jgi:hypothetical protein
MDSYDREFLSLSVCWGSGACQAIAMHLRDRAPKHEHQAEAKKDSADDFHFMLFIFLSLFRPSVISGYSEFISGLSP